MNWFSIIIGIFIGSSLACMVMSFCAMGRKVDQSRFDDIAHPALNDRAEGDFAA